MLNDTIVHVSAWILLLMLGTGVASVTWSCVKKAHLRHGGWFVMEMVSLFGGIFIPCAVVCGRVLGAW